MLTKIKGIVLHHIKYKESSAIVHMYTDRYGRQAYIISNIMGKKGGHRSNLLQPLFILEVEVYHKPERELHRVREIHHCIPFRTIPYDMKKSAQALFIAEILYRSLKEEESDPKLFDFLVHAIQWLDTTENNYSSFHLLLLVQLTKYLGFYPNDNFSSINRLFDLRNGQFTGIKNVHTDIMGSDESETLHAILKKAFSDLSDIRIEYHLKQQLITSLLDYYRLHVHGFGIIKSLPVLREIFE
jgi:DNA repair protein RecO (recombination protein O)